MHADLPEIESGGSLLMAGRGLSPTFMFCGPVFGEQLTEGDFGAPASRKSFDDVAKIGFWINSVMSGADEQAVENCAAISGFWTSHTEPILTTNGCGVHVALDTIVIDLDLTVIILCTLSEKIFSSKNIGSRRSPRAMQ